jgi:hypothetical protein
MTVDTRKIALLEDKLLQLEDKVNAFQLKSQTMSLTSMYKKDNSLSKDTVNQSQMSIRALEH